MAIFFILPGALIMNPALQNIAEVYPQIPFTMILLLSTITLLIVVPTSLIAGAIAGNRVTYRKLLFIAIILYVAGGIMPYFINNFYWVLGSRILFGIGVGLATPLPNGLVMRLFEGQRRADMTGMEAWSSTLPALFSCF